MIANAGVGSYGPFVDLDPAHLDEMMDVNAKGVITTAAATVPHLIARGGGDFVSVASEAGRRGLPVRGRLLRLQVRPGRLHPGARPRAPPAGRALHQRLPRRRRDRLRDGGRLRPDARHARARRDDVRRRRRRDGALRADPAAQPPHPRGCVQAHDRDELGVDDGREVGNPLDRRHQQEAPRRGGGDGRRRRRRRRQPQPRAGRGVRAGLGHPARLRDVRGAARRPGRRGDLHPAPEHDAQRVVDQGDGGRQARPLREAVQPSHRRCRAGLRRCRRDGDASLGSLHVSPPSADGAPRGARCVGGDRGAARDPLGLQLLALRRRQHPPAHGRRGRLADGRRLLLHQRRPPARRRARVGRRARRTSARAAPTGCSPG